MLFVLQAAQESYCLAANQSKLHKGVIWHFGFGGQTDYYMDEQKAVKTSGEQDKYLRAVISTASGNFRYL